MRAIERSRDGCVGWCKTDGLVVRIVDGFCCVGVAAATLLGADAAGTTGEVDEAAGDDVGVTSTAFDLPVSCPLPSPPLLPSSSRYASLSSSGTSSSLRFPSASWLSRTSSSLSCMISALLFSQAAHFHAPLSLAIFSRASLLHSMPPSWPFASVSMKLRMATRAVRTPHAGCHVSSWWPDILRQISRLTSKRPVGVRKRKAGGRRGYCGGRMMRPW